MTWNEIADRLTSSAYDETMLGHSTVHYAADLLDGTEIAVPDDEDEADRLLRGAIAIVDEVVRVQVEEERKAGGWGKPEGWTREEILAEVRD